jgi:hypothetical protein
MGITVTVVGCQALHVIPTLARIGSRESGRFPYTLQMIPNCLLGSWITGNSHTAWPLINQMNCTGEHNVIRYDQVSNPGSFDPGPNVLTTQLRIACGVPVIHAPERPHWESPRSRASNSGFNGASYNIQTIPSSPFLSAANYISLCSRTQLRNNLHKIHFPRNDLRGFI